MSSAGDDATVDSYCSSSEYSSSPMEFNHAFAAEYPDSIKECIGNKFSRMLDFFSGPGCDNL